MPSQAWLLAFASVVLAGGALINLWMVIVLRRVFSDLRSMISSIHNFPPDQPPGN